MELPSPESGPKLGGFQAPDSGYSSGPRPPECRQSGGGGVRKLFADDDGDTPRSSPAPADWHEEEGERNEALPHQPCADEQQNPPSAAAESEPSAGAPLLGKRPRLFGLCSTRLWQLIALLLLAVIIWLVLTETSCSKVMPCPENWIGFGGKCYYFSNNTMNWDDSKEYCTSRDAALPVIKEKLQLEHIERFRQFYYYWIGLKKEGAGWQWIDGSLFTNQVISLENEDPNLNCAFLNSEKIVTVDCTSLRRWICVKESN